jgi:hypothetical protein
LKKKTNFLLVQNRFFPSVFQLKKKSQQMFVKKNRRFIIRNWWNYLMSLSTIGEADFYSWLFFRVNLPVIDTQILTFNWKILQFKRQEKLLEFL